MRSTFVGGVLLAGAVALGSAGAALAAGPGDGQAPDPRPAAAPSVAQGTPPLDNLPLSGNQLSPLGTLLGS
ncbi:hypothetical protein AB6O49_04525 [Streptomyces sp. SBR177]|uniref:hypothetical protein n=1 Tax=unclassified Streptomyces TaxID=2593676 RepID=UPI0033DC84F7